MGGKSSGVKPLISGGRTLSKMHSGKKGSGHSKPKKKATWFQDGTGRIWDRPTSYPSWPQGEVPELVQRIREGRKS